MKQWPSQQQIDEALEVIASVRNLPSGSYALGDTGIGYVMERVPNDYGRIMDCRLSLVWSEAVTEQGESK